MNQFFSETTRHLDSSDDLAIVLPRVARSIVPELADFCLVFLERDGVVACAAAAHVSADGERLLRRLNRVYKITRDDPISTVASVLRSGRPRLRAEITSEVEAPFAHLAVFTLHRRLGTRSALVVPIGASPNVVGAISLCFAESGRRYSAQDVPPARRLANQVAAFLRGRTRESGAPLPLTAAGRRSVPLRARV